MNSHLSRYERQARINENCLQVDHLTGDMAKRTARGSLLTIGSQIARMVIQLVSTAILARLLTPSDFGLVGMAYTATVFASLFSELGLTTPTIQRPDIDQGKVSTLFFLGLAVSGAIVLLLLVTSPLVGTFFHDSRVSALAAVLSLPVFLSAMATQHNALLCRGMRWVPLSIIPIVSQIGGLLAAVVVIALAGPTFWALAVQAISASTISLILMWTVLPWRPSFVFEFRRTWPEIKVGLHYAGFSLINYFHRQLDNVLIGRRWGEVELGFYTRAYTLMMMPITLVNGPVGSTMGPLLSRCQNRPEDWTRYLLKAYAWICFIGFLIACLLIACSEPLVLTLLGPKWSNVIPIFVFLAMSMFGMTPINATGWIYLSTGRTDRMFLWSLYFTATIVIAFLIGLPYGAKGLALAYSVAISLNTLPCLWNATRGTPVRLGTMVSVIRGPAIASAFSLSVSFTLGNQWLAGESAFIRLLAYGMVSGTVYLIVASLAIHLDPAQRDQRADLYAALAAFCARIGATRLIKN